MKHFERLTSFFILAFIILGITFAKIDLKYTEAVYLVEDGVLEWLTVVPLLCGAYISFERFFMLYKERSKEFNFCLFILGMLFIFGAGEEVSWGQRMFAVRSPEFFIHNNSQGETNLHNLILGGVKINRLIFGTILGIVIASYFLILPVLFLKIKRIRELINRFGIPIPRYFHLAMYIALFVLVKMIDSGRRGEALEFGGCWIFLMMILNPKNIEIYKKNY